MPDQTVEQLAEALAAEQELNANQENDLADLKLRVARLEDLAAAIAGPAEVIADRAHQVAFDREHPPATCEDCGDTINESDMAVHRFVAHGVEGDR